MIDECRDARKMAKSNNTLDVALLKGERWTYADGSTSKGKAIVHRSPLIDENEWRLTLKVDVVNFGCECEEEH